MLQVLTRLAAASPQRQKALDHLRRAQAPLAALEGDVTVDDRGRPAAAEILHQDRNPAVRRHRPETNLMVQFEVKPITRHRSIQVSPKG